MRWGLRIEAADRCHKCPAAGTDHVHEYRTGAGARGLSALMPDGQWHETWQARDYDLPVSQSLTTVRRYIRRDARIRHDGVLAPMRPEAAWHVGL